MAGRTITLKNYDGLHTNPAYSHAAVVSGNASLLHIGGQNATDASGRIVGAGDLGAQTRRTLENLRIILKAEGAGFEDLVKMNIYLLAGSDPRVGFRAYQEVVGELKQPPLVTVLMVAGLARPEALIEIDAIAVLPRAVHKD